MGIMSIPISLDKLYEKEVAERNALPVMVNDHPLETPEDVRAFNAELVTQYDGETISSVPSCFCKYYKAAIFKHHVCERCGHEVLPPLERSIKMAAWMRTPKHVNWFINPLILSQLRSIYRSGNFNAIDYVLDPNYHTSDKRESVQEIKALNLPRGLNNFYNNWQGILAAINNCKTRKPKYSKAAIANHMRYFQKQFEKGNMFCKHIPVPSKIMFITEKTVYGTYADNLMLEGIEPAKIIASISRGNTPMTKSVILSRAAKANIKMAEYHVTNWDARWVKQEGILRKHLYSTRTDWAMRLVLSSDTRLNVEEDEIAIPWAAAMTTFESHIAAKLLKRGYRERTITRIIESNTVTNDTKWKPLLKKIFDELLEECEYGAGYGIPAIFLRNPSLTRGSSQLLRITKIKDDCRDKTVSANLLIFKAPNADLDGDTVTVAPILDKSLYEKAKWLEPRHYVMSLNQTFSVGPYCVNPGEAKSTLRHWLESDKVDD